ncbi:cell wall hydrolase [Dorea acetigenes]|uniref:Cell wall hydrolase n=1 Tax=Dorea acetigenes TaxID=2981787 RepID=A0ABT2RR42_9FIRM|nr:cell wall hydrolase [Dorea acetigenes]MCU6687879.1 cell wall hydrolase [Dorea acetigenes]SCJ59550.1 Germination-specific amidase [uncultured Clostridium sp.]
MLNYKIKKKAVMAVLGATLLAAGFTSRAAALQPEDTADMKASEVQEHGRVNEALSNAVTLTTVGKAKEVLQTKAEEAIKAEEARKAEEEARRAEEAAAAAGQRERELLASIIFCEAGNQSYEGQVAVGAVVMNRVNSASYPNSIEEVIYQSGQFTPAMTGWLDNVRVSAGYTQAAMQAAEDALAGVNPVGNCLYFDQGGYGMQIGAHFFH